MFYISQERFLRDLMNFLDSHKGKFKDVDCICAISRGGLIVGVYLSYKLDKPLLIAYRTERGWGFVKDRVYDDFSVNSILLVDEIFDSGKTLKKVSQKLKKKYPEAQILTATLYKKDREQKDFAPHVYQALVPDRWVVFWYDKEYPRRFVC